MASTLNILEHTERTPAMRTPASADTPNASADTPNACHLLPLHSRHTSVHASPSSLTEDGDVGTFDCNICLDVCRAPVATLCGHLFCWPCLYYWLSLHSTSSKECPVCKADVQHKIVPLYGCGNATFSTDSSAEKFHGMRIPCRPSATTWIPNRSIQHLEMHGGTARHINISARHSTASSHLGFYAAVVRFGIACLRPLYFLRSSTSILVQGGRFNNKKEFVLHWGFILSACVAISFFLLC